MDSSLDDLLSQAFELYSTGRPELASEMYQRILTRAPESALAWNNLGNSRVQLRDYAGAEACYRRAVGVDPGFNEAFTNLGTLLNLLRRFEESLEAYQKSILLKPDQPRIWLAIGQLLSKMGKVDESIEAYRRGLEQAPGEAWALNNLGSLLMNKGRMAEALELFDRAIAANGNYCEAHNNKGLALDLSGRAHESIAPFQKAAELSPKSALIRSNMGNAYFRAGQLDEAIKSYEKAIELDPNYALGHYNLGTAFKESGLMEQALGEYQKASELAPDDASAGSNLLYTMHFSPETDLATLLKAHRAWNDIHGAKTREKRRTKWNVDTNPNRPLRVGFVSPDFRLHPVGRFFKPLIARFDRSKIQSVCYSDTLNPDDITRDIRSSAAEWRETTGMTHEALADQIVNDGIDILVDLTMHMAGNRMLLFALKPAPVQVTWLAYCSTTGLETMDYRISDPHMDPPGRWEKHYSEMTVRLPRTYWCYEAPAMAPEVGELPAATAGIFTFGCLNNISKINDGVLDAWSEILQNTPNSRLILHVRKGEAQRVMLERFARRGIEARRIEFADILPFGDYLALHHRIDLALDPFPYNGGTTTCDALWMGVPVATLAGDRPMGRAGASLLANIGLENLIFNNVKEYVKMVTVTAGRPDELAMLRKTLRQRMLNSPLMDADVFVRDFSELLVALRSEKAKSGS